MASIYAISDDPPSRTRELKKQFQLENFSFSVVDKRDRNKDSPFQLGPPSTSPVSGSLLIIQSAFGRWIKSVRPRTRYTPSADIASMLLAALGDRWPRWNSVSYCHPALSAVSHTGIQDLVSATGFPF